VPKEGVEVCRPRYQSAYRSLDINRILAPSLLPLPDFLHSSLLQKAKEKGKGNYY